MADFGITENIWLLLVVGGPVLLGLLIAFAMTRQRKVSRAEHMAGERATRELYSPADRDRPLDTK